MDDCSNLIAVQIRISGTSGYVPEEIAYNDTLIITDHSIECDCHPYIPWKMNPNQKWCFTTDSITFIKLFELAAEAVLEIFRRDPKCSCTDTPKTRFDITFSNGKSISKRYLTGTNEFKECFDIIRMMIPGCELMPGVLKTYEDYDKRRLWHEVVDRYYPDEISFSEADILVDAMWDLRIKGKTDIKCPRCGSELGIETAGDVETVYCKKEDCISVMKQEVRNHENDSCDR